jgi:hypothetical protein
LVGTEHGKDKTEIGFADSLMWVKPDQKADSLLYSREIVRMLIPCQFSFLSILLKGTVSRDYEQEVGGELLLDLGKNRLRLVIFLICFFTFLGSFVDRLRFPLLMLW